MFAGTSSVPWKESRCNRPSATAFNRRSQTVRPGYSLSGVCFWYNHRPIVSFFAPAPLLRRVATRCPIILVNAPRTMLKTTVVGS